ncbi:MAG: hypothetical protein K1000chlam1_01077 [Candidatus Anoxychlamydiales bacterium]|nr:hypothetical protein [Candidatus Anoxychlamydiales bacterium]
MKVENSKTQSFEDFQNRFIIRGIIFSSSFLTSYFLFFDKAESSNSLKGLDLIKRNVKLLNLRKVGMAAAVGIYAGASIGFYGGFCVSCIYPLTSELKKNIKKKTK